jgi:hypothetical protein
MVSKTKNADLKKILIGPPKLTRFERARIVGARALQISMGAPLLIEVPEGQRASVDLARARSALLSGLFLFNRWKEATLVLLCQIAIWFAHPFAWYQLMPLVSWQYLPVIVFIVVPPIRKWIIHSIVTRNRKRLPIALWCLAWIARIGGDVAVGNNIAVWVLNWGTPEFYVYWAPMTIYYAVVESLNCFIGAIIGTGVLISLQKGGITITALDYLQSKLDSAT